MNTITLEQIFNKQIKASQDITEEEKEIRDKVQQEIEVLAKELEEIKLHENKKNITVSIIDSSRIGALIASIKIGEFKKAGEFSNNTIFNDNRIELVDFGWRYAGILKREFTNETNNKLKFETDFKTEMDCSPKLNLTQFIDSEIERLNDINELIVTCFGKSRAYRKFEQYISMCNYLEFLQNYKPTTIQEKGKFPESIEKIFPTINIEKYNPDLIFINFKNIFSCKNRAVFDAWLVDGIGCTTKMTWLNKRRGAATQLKTFISEITGKTDLLVEPINLAFDLPIDSNTRITSLSNEISLLLKSCLKK